jgi:valyl-tRNA synthetase
MSKSKGNVIDPMQLVEEYGADAFRMGIIATESPGNNRPFDVGKIVAARNFCNKLWNIARYIEGVVGDDHHERLKPNPKSSADHWMLSRLNDGLLSISSSLEKYRYADAYNNLYHLVWDDFADWYLEASKRQLNPGILAHVLESLLIAVHPFAPFASETIWQTLKWEAGLLAAAKWPTSHRFNKEKVAEFNEIQKIVTEIRYITKTMSLKKVSLYYSDVSFLAENSELITKLAGISGVHNVQDGKGLNLTQTSYNCWLDVDHHTIADYSSKLKARYDDQQKQVSNLEARLANKNYVDNAPKAIVNQTKQQLDEAKQLLDSIATELSKFSALV